MAPQTKRKAGWSNFQHAIAIFYGDNPPYERSERSSWCSEQWRGFTSQEKKECENRRGANALVKRKFHKVPSVLNAPGTYPIKSKARGTNTKKNAVADKKGRGTSNKKPVGDKKGRKSRRQPRDAPGPSRTADPVDDNAEEEENEEFPGFCQEDIDRVENEIIQQDLNVDWDDIVNLQDMKDEMIEATMMPVWFPSYFTGLRTPSKGLLLFGPPGTGKTMAAKAVATACSYTFFNIKASTIASPLQGVSETLAKLIFVMARAKGPSVIFFDEVDALCPPRGALGESESSRKVLSEILTQMDGINNSADTSRSVVVIGATNRPWDLDDAMIRRFETRLYVPLPNAQARLEMLEKNLEPYTVAQDVVLLTIAANLKGFSGDDMRVFSRNVSMMGMRDKKRGKSPAEIRALSAEELESVITVDHFKRAERSAKPSIDKELIERHEKWNEEFGSK